MQTTGDIFQGPREKKPVKVLKNPVFFFDPIIVSLHCSLNESYWSIFERNLGDWRILWARIPTDGKQFRQKNRNWEN